METVLKSVVNSPGVVGGMITDGDGRVLTSLMPTIYDAEQLARTGALLLEQQFGLEDATGGVKQAEVRFELGKLVTRSARERTLIMLCEPEVNLQVLSIALNVAAKKMEKLPHIVPTPVSEGGKKEALPSEVRKNDGIPAAYRASGFFR